MNENETELPIIFISYSHDSADHKKWVAHLATKLFESGIKVILDQWDLSLGDSPTRFMESGINDADRVLLICTQEYVRKAEAGEGGAGYERMIVTSELAQKIDTNKFIPVTRQESSLHDIPVFLGDRFFADFNDDSQFENQLHNLIRDLKKIPHIDKPVLTKDSVEKKRKSVNLVKDIILGEVEKLSLDDIYQRATASTRNNDQMAWRDLIKEVQPLVYGRLMIWRNKYESNAPKDLESLHNAVDEAINEVAPLLIISLVGIISGKDGFKDQRSMLDDLMNISGWNRAGLTTLVELPQTLGFIYQGLHGAACFYSDQIGQGIVLANMKIKDRHDENYLEVWRDTGLMGWPESLGGNCINAWEYLFSAPERWDWLNKIFKNMNEFHICISGYYLTLNINELVYLIVDGHVDAIQNGPENYHLDVPVCFLRNQDSTEKAMLRLVRQPKAVEAIWASKNISRQKMEKLWPSWININHRWLMSVYRFPHLRNLADEKFFEALGN